MTPAPWIVDRPTPSERWVMGTEPETGRLVLVAACETSEDAAAIAALPELLAAAKDAAHALTDAGVHPATLHALNTAVAKVEGTHASGLARSAYLARSFDLFYRAMEPK